MSREDPDTLKDGHSDIAHPLAEAWARHRLSGEEWQVLWVIIRQTYGWHCSWAKISLQQFYEAIGMKKPSIIRAIKKLINKNIVSKRANEKSQSYHINSHFKQWDILKTVSNIANLSMTVSKRANEPLAKELMTVSKRANEKSSNPTSEAESEAPKESSKEIYKDKDISIVSKDTETKLKVKDETQIKAIELIKEFCLLRGIPLDSGFFSKNIRVARSLVNHYEIEIVLAGTAWRLENDDYGIYQEGYYHKKLWTLNFVFSNLAQWIAEASQKPHPKTFTDWLIKNPDLDYRKLEVETMKEKNEYAKVKAFFLAFSRALKEGVIPTTEEWDKYQSARNLSKEQGGK